MCVQGRGNQSTCLTVCQRVSTAATSPALAKHHPVQGFALINSIYTYLSGAPGTLNRMAERSLTRCNLACRRGWASWLWNCGAVRFGRAGDR